MSVTVKYSVKNLRSLFFPKLGSYPNVWGWSYRGKKIGSVLVERYNVITYYDENGKDMATFQDNCYLDD